MVEQRVAAEVPSSAKGAEAKAWALRSLRSFARYFAAERAVTRTWSERPSLRARRHDREASRLYRLSSRQAEKAKALFRELGLG